MKFRSLRRGVAILGVAAAAAVSVIAAPTAAEAHGIQLQLPGLLRLSPRSGSVDDDPIGNYSTTKACPASYRTMAMVALQAHDGTPNRLSGNLVPTAEKPSGALNTALKFVILSSDLTTGYYEVDLLCYNADFKSVKADVNLIKVNVEAGTWFAVIR